MNRIILFKKLFFGFIAGLTFIFFQNATTHVSSRLQTSNPHITYISDNARMAQSTHFLEHKIVRDVPFASSTSNLDKFCGEHIPMCYDIMFNTLAKRPLVVFIHGGGWKSGDYKGHIDQIGKTFYDNGYAFASIGYRLYSKEEPKVSLMDVVKDAAAAISLIQKRASQYNITNSVVIVGHSAGAHLAALLGAHPELLQKAGAIKENINGVVLLDASVYDFLSLKGANEGLRQHATRDEAMQKELSPIYHVEMSNQMPPVYLASDIVRSQEDKLHYPGTGAQAELLKEVLVSKNSPVRYQQFSDKTHGDFLHALKEPNDKMTMEILKFVSFVQPEKLVPVASEVNPLVSSLIFDWRVYYVKNKSLFENSMNDQQKIEKHWLNHGLDQGLASDSDFDLKTLFNNYPRLKESVHSSYKLAARFYVNHGHWLGYRAVPLRTESDTTFGGSLPEDLSDAPLGNTIIGNDRIKLVTTAKYAGAVTELWYKDIQIVNSGAYGYGRLFQMAAWKYRQGACYNPIEAGGRYLADEGESTKTIIKKLEVGAGFFYSQVVPSLFRKRGEDIETCKRKNKYFDEKLLPFGKQVLDEKILFAKNIELNALGRPNIIKFDIEVSSLADVPHLTFQLYAALNLEMNQIYSLPLDSCLAEINKLKENPSSVKSKIDVCKMQKRDEMLLAEGSKFKYSNNLPAVLTNKAKNVALAFYSPVTKASDESLLSGNYSAEERSGDGDQGTSDMSVNFTLLNVKRKTTITVPVYVFVGNFEAVEREYMWALNNL